MLQHPPSPRAAATDTAVITTTSNDVNVYRALVGCLLAGCKILLLGCQLYSVPTQNDITHKDCSMFNSPSVLN